MRERPHSCSKCGWTFAEAGNLKHHMQVGQRLLFLASETKNESPNLFANRFTLRTNEGCLSSRVLASASSKGHFYSDLLRLMIQLRIDVAFLIVSNLFAKTFKHFVFG